MKRLFYTVAFLFLLNGCAAAEHRFRTQCAQRHVREPERVERCVKAKKVVTFVVLPVGFGVFFLAI